MDLLFLNVYLVTRHFGGREEGGWWYNVGEPLASVPLAAVRQRGHDSICAQCNQARQGQGEFCRELPEDFSYDLEVINLASILYYESSPQDQHMIVPLIPFPWEELSEEAQEPFLDQAAAQVRLRYPEVFHLTLKDEEFARAERRRLEELFLDANQGNIYSVNGGQKIDICLEQSMASNWPKTRPIYE